MIARSLARSRLRPPAWPRPMPDPEHVEEPARPSPPSLATAAGLGHLWESLAATRTEYVRGFRSAFDLAAPAPVPAASGPGAESPKAAAAAEAADEVTAEDLKLAAAQAREALPEQAVLQAALAAHMATARSVTSEFAGGFAAGREAELRKLREQQEDAP